MSSNGTEQKCRDVRSAVAIRGKAEVVLGRKRPTRMTQLGHQSALDVAVAEAVQPYQSTRLSRYDAAS